MLIILGASIFTPANIITVIVLIGVIAVCFKATLKHMKGEGSCCGGGESEKKVKKKKLSSVSDTKLYRVLDMKCVNCEVKVHNALNELEHINADVNYKKKEVIVKSDEAISSEVIIKTLRKEGYTAEEIHI